MDAGARLDAVDHHQADQQGERGHRLEVEEGDQTDSADLFQIAHAADAHHDRAEDNRTDQHRHEFDKPQCDRIQGGSFLRPHGTKNGAEHGAHQDLEPKLADDFH